MPNATQTKQSNTQTKGAPGNTLKPADNIITFEMEYPLLSALKDLGIAAKLRNGRVALAPADKITPKIESKVRQHNEALIGELQRVYLAEAEAKASEFEITPNSNRYANLTEAQLEAVNEEWILAYELAAELYNNGNKNPIWNGDIPNLSKPLETTGGPLPPVPFYWVHDIKLINPNDKTVEYKFWCMFRDLNSNDSVVVEQKLRDMLKARKMERGY